MIRKISDIEIGKEYKILLVNEKKYARKCIVKAIINEEKHSTRKTEIYVDLFQKGKLSSSNLLYFCEIGIGENNEEAFKNYGEFDYEENPNFETCFENIRR
jgi:hypothetical protein